MTASEPSEDGFTLIELIIAVFILGLTFVAILGAMGTTIVASDIHRKQADTNSFALSAAEKVKSRDVAYVACATPSEATYLAAARNIVLPSGWNVNTAVTITSVLYETRSSTGTSYQSTCYDSNGIKVQLITLQVTSPDAKASTTLTFTKSGNT